MQTNINLAVERVCGNIRKVREFRNLTQQHIGTVLGLAQNGYAKIEANQTRLTIDRLYIIADALSVQVTDLIDLDLSKIERRDNEDGIIVRYGNSGKPYAVNYFRNPSDA